MFGFLWRRNKPDWLQRNHRFITEKFLTFMFFGRGGGGGGAEDCGLKSLNLYFNTVKIHQVLVQNKTQLHNNI